MKATLYTDGGARGNPGPAGIGYVLTLEDKKVIAKGEYIGETTNNQAEYKALLAGMTCAKAEKVETLSCFLDSELVVRQLQGRYRVKNADLKPLFEQVKSLMSLFKKVTFTHVLRAKNKKADLLVNQAIDAATQKKSGS